MRFLTLARRMLEKHNGPQRVVAFCLRKGKIVSTGVNSYTKSHPRQRSFAVLAGQPKKEYLHAEIDALIGAPSDVDTIVVVRINRKGEPVLSTPCPVCSLAIAKSGIRRVIHT